MVKPEVALQQEEKDKAATASVTGGVGGQRDAGGGQSGSDGSQDGAAGGRADGNTRPKRYHGMVGLDATRAGRDAGRIAEEVIAHLAGLVGANVTVTLEIDATVPDGVPESVVRTVTENSRTLKFTSQGFEKE